MAADPSDTATSLLLIGKYQAAADITSQLIEAVYHRRVRSPYEQPTNYARTLLILGLAEAGLGRLDKAAVTGTAALACSRPVWPTMVLAGSLIGSWEYAHRGPLKPMNTMTATWRWPKAWLTRCR